MIEKLHGFGLDSSPPSYWYSYSKLIANFVCALVVIPKILPNSSGTKVQKLVGFSSFFLSSKYHIQWPIVRNMSHSLSLSLFFFSFFFFFLPKKHESFLEKCPTRSKMTFTMIFLTWLEVKIVGNILVNKQVLIQQIIFPIISKDIRTISQCYKITLWKCCL